jgi:hypothetical protein
LVKFVPCCAANIPAGIPETVLVDLFYSPTPLLLHLGEEKWVYPGWMDDVN